MSDHTAADPLSAPNLAKRRQILEGAWRVFVAEGLEGASVDQLAKEAGVSKPTLYRYFSSKEDIFQALLHEQINAVGPLQFELDPAAGDPATLLTRLGVGFMMGVMQERSLDMFRLVVAESRKHPSVGNAFEASGPTQGRTALARYLRQLHRSGTLRIDDAELAAEQFIALCQAGIFRRAHTVHERVDPKTIRRLVSSAVRLFLRGYAAAPSAT